MGKPFRNHDLKLAAVRHTFSYPVWIERWITVRIIRRIRNYLLLAAVLVLPWTQAVGWAVPITQAASNVYFGSNGNCNSWVPHGWSWTQWSGWPTPVSAGVDGTLQWNTGYSWVDEKYNEKSAYGTSGDATVDNYLGTALEGSGSWREIGAHNGGLWDATQHSLQSIWCG